MGKKKLPKVTIPEIDTLMEGMQSLLVDEYGHPLPPDHPQVKRVATFMDQISASMEHEDGGTHSGPLHGNA